jgi:hypothetical protein
MTDVAAGGSAAQAEAVEDRPLDVRVELTRMRDEMAALKAEMIAIKKDLLMVRQGVGVLLVRRQ